MKITSATFLRLSLFIPYIFGIASFYLSMVIDSGIEPGTDLSIWEDIIKTVEVPIALITIIYTIGAFYWLIPYTFLAIFLWAWSMKKEKLQIYKTFMTAPLILIGLIIVYSAIMSLFNFFPGFFSLKSSLGSLVCVVPFSIFFGYVFIGLTAWIYHYLQQWGIIIDPGIFTLQETN
jgi:hypothetical protein